MLSIRTMIELKRPDDANLDSNRGNQACGTGNMTAVNNGNGNQPSHHFRAAAYLRFHRRSRGNALSSAKP